VDGKCSYSAYGSPDCEGTAKTPLGYDGQYTNADTGLQYLRARSYDPATGQFMSVDPAVESTGMPYGFAADDPLNASDPLGLESTTEAELQVESNANQLQTDVGIWQERLRQLHQEQAEAEKCGNKSLASQRAAEAHTVVVRLLGEIELLRETFAQLSELEKKEIAGELLKLLAGHGDCTVVGLGGGAVGGAVGTVGGPPGELAGATVGELGTDLLCDQIAQAVSP
jgi:RHS repeat-associated protein